MEEAPATIDRYAIDAVLGEGGMGRVYRATDPRLGRRVALKVLLASGSSERARAVARARMMREARAAAAFNHPNVVAVYDVGEFEGNPFIAMELVSGTTLRDTFQDAYLPQAQKLAWLLDVARGLGAAHRAGLVHRDVKPENVMITDEGVVKILDFGIARATETEATVDPVAPTFATFTARGVAVGTPQYMPPEQLNGEELDGRTDQFAWGVMAWEALAGVSPWGGKSGAQLITAVLSTPVKPLTELLPNVDPQLSNAIARALKKNRDERFPTMDALIAAIEGESLRAPSPASSQGRMREPPPSQDTGRALVQATKASATPEQRRRRRRWVMGAGGLGALAVVLLWFAFRAPVVTSSAAAALVPPPDAAPAPATTTKMAPEMQAYFEVAAAAEREGRHDRACDEYQRASAAYPGSAEAALQVALCLRNDATAGRAYFRRAWALRGSLSPRDAAVLDAFEPLFQRDPVDLAEEKARLEAAVARFPNDAPLRYFLAGAYRLDSNDIERAVVEIERSLTLDPNQPHVLAVESDFHAYDGDFKGAHAAIDRCLRLAPSTLECLQEEQWLDSEEGECAKMESAARRMLAIDPSYAAGVHALANAVFAREGTVSTVRELLKRARMGGDAGVADTRIDEARMAILAGDFATAEKLARNVWIDARSSEVAIEHAVPARLLLSILHESGRDAEAATLAEAYLQGRDAWEPDPKLDDWALHDEPTPLMLVARRRAGLLSQAAYTAEIRKTVDRWLGRVTPATRNFVWIYGYVEPSETPDDARLAIAERARFEPVPKFKPLSLADEAIGRVYALAGQPDLALPALERATRSCFPLDHPMKYVRAHYELGLVREAKGDRDGACDAYGVVRSHWGEAKPKSVTFELALARINALKCPK